MAERRNHFNLRASCDSQDILPRSDASDAGSNSFRAAAFAWPLENGKQVHTSGRRPFRLCAKSTDLAKHDTPHHGTTALPSLYLAASSDRFNYRLTGIRRMRWDSTLGWDVSVQSCRLNVSILDSADWPHWHMAQTHPTWAQSQSTAALSWSPFLHSFSHMAE